MFEILNTEQINAATLSDLAIWTRFKNGDKESLALIFNAHYDALYIYGKKLMPDEDLVKDVIQNLFLKLWQSRETLSEITVIKPYLLKALRRHILDEKSRLSKIDIYKQSIKNEYDFVFSVEDNLIRKHEDETKEARLGKAFKNLTKRQREVVFLKFYEGLSYEHISEITNLNLQSVRNLIYQAIKILKESLLTWVLVGSLLSSYFCG